MTQQHALAEERSRDEASRAQADGHDDGDGYDKLDGGGGGFAGADAKKRRGVRPRAPPPLPRSPSARTR